MSETKFCRDCVHSIGVNGGGAPTCAHPDVRVTSVVTGRSVLPFCYIERTSGKCGRDAALFVQRPREVVHLHVGPLRQKPAKPPKDMGSAGCAALFVLAPFLCVLAALLCGGGA